MAWLLGRAYDTWKNREIVYNNVSYWVFFESKAFLLNMFELITPFLHGKHK